MAGMLEYYVSLQLYFDDVAWVYDRFMQGIAMWQLILGVAFFALGIGACYVYHSAQQCPMLLKPQYCMNKTSIHLIISCLMDLVVAA